MFACSFMISTFCFFIFFISDTGAENDFEIVNATVLLRSNTGCFRIVIVDDSDPEPEENFTISFVVNKVQPEGLNISINQSEAVIIIQENDRKSHWCVRVNCLFPCMSIINCCILFSQVHTFIKLMIRRLQHTCWPTI